MIFRQCANFVIEVAIFTVFCCYMNWNPSAWFHILVIVSVAYTSVFKLDLRNLCHFVLPASVKCIFLIKNCLISFSLVFLSVKIKVVLLKSRSGELGNTEYVFERLDNNPTFTLQKYLFAYLLLYVCQTALCLQLFAFHLVGFYFSLRKLLFQFCCTVYKYV